MEFSQISGLDHLKSHLKNTVATGRIPHAQLFVGPNGSGLLPMAIAYAAEILCRGYEEGSLIYEQCKNKVNRLNHPDLHFVYPVNTNEQIKKNAISDNFSEEWRQFISENPYASLYEWLQKLGIETKQGNISKFEAEQISKKLSLKAYEGNYKVMIIWMAEYMNVECSNKILKLIEEPSDKTVLLLIAENEGQILDTIKSRCQLLKFPLLSEAEISSSLVTDHNISESSAHLVAKRARGDYNRALQLLQEEQIEDEFEKLFLDWVRTAFTAKGNKGAINDLLNWSEKMAGKNREMQKQFLDYCGEIFRQALLANYQVDDLVYFEGKDRKFSIEKFAPFVHQNNIEEIITALEEGIFNIERNGNSKIIFTDLSIKLTRFIHTPA